MKITVISVGRSKGYLDGALKAYRERASRYWKMETIEISNARGAGKDGMEDEGRRILQRVPDGNRLWALTRKGKGITSEGLAALLESLAVGSEPGIVFAVGGAYGLSSSVLERADRRLSLSPMTLPHDLARLLLFEQLYRAGTIRRNEPYHKGS